MTATSALVAGGAGFLGSHLCTSLLRDGYSVICVDNFGSGRESNIAHLQGRKCFECIEADIREPVSFPPADEVYHLASRASPADFMQYPVRIALTNTQGTKHLLDYAVEHDARMLFASTSEVYGDPTVHPQPESYTGNVNIRGPRGCYDESKRFGETLTVAYGRKYDIDIRTVRIFNTYGPRMRPGDGRVVPTFVSQALTEDDLTVYGDGTQTRSFCYVSDLISGIRAAMSEPGMAGEVFNLGGTQELEIRQLAEKVVELSGAGSEIVYEPLPEDDPARRKPDISKAREQLGWEPSVSLNTGLERTIDHFQRELTR